ncbi:hypothetical protein CEUSTIGMA_g1970.t1 [Chlamydomonas eustigma]|uniref:Uncharacterized protein n=1 Tax=Chlamydomonas eustigma TaxID=1157962 RepID=A0A250WUP0_9CHLO|nr:hypothetical protein CEUSTIGMA_g1970.t1 [Chlamydomonas eustigma]|eukprot:GAX74521.1 hypothetical protein CEUSTIGMA_g1970.t1 [Chlamydomonas eustigma]
MPPAISVAVALCIISSAAAVDMLRPSQPFHPTPSIPPINGTGTVQLSGGVWLSPWQTALACIVVVVGFIILGVTACLVAHCVKTRTSRSGRVEPTTGHQVLMDPLHLGTSSMTPAAPGYLLYDPCQVCYTDICWRAHSCCR